MMRPVLLAFPPLAPSGLAFDPTTMTLTWTDNSVSETAFVVEKSTDGVTWTAVGGIERALTAPNTTGVESFTDPAWLGGESYRVLALNTVGDTSNYADPNLNEIVSGGFPTYTVKSVSEVITTALPPVAIAAP